MKKILYIMCMCVLALGLLSGCGGEFAEEMEAGKDASKALTGAAVSGQAVSGQSIQTDGDSDSPEKGAEQKNPQGVLDNRYCTEQYYYSVLFDFDDYDENDVYLAYIDQISLATGKERKIRIDDIEDLVCVEKDALYYTRLNDDDDDYYSLWRLPIERRGDGTEELRVDQQEPVKGLDDIYYEEDAIYIDDEYIVYSGTKGDEEDTDVIRYDRASGKKVSLPVSQEVKRCIECEIVNIYRNGSCLELVTSVGIVTWNVKTEDVALCKVRSIDEDENEIAITEDVCFYETYETGDCGWNILRVDMKTKEKTEFVSKKEVFAVLQEEAGVSKEQAEEQYVYGLYYDENRLYMEIYGQYEKDGKSINQSIILSRENAVGAPLQYEKGLTEYMWDDNGKRDVDKNGDYVWSNAYLLGIRGGMAYVRRYEASDDNIMYDIKTGKTRAASWEETLSVE